MNEFVVFQDPAHLNHQMEHDLRSEIIKLKRENESLKAFHLQEMKQKELILKEVHHRVKNNMNTLSNLFDIQISMSSNVELIQLLNQAKSRINSMTVIYNKLFLEKDVLSTKTRGYIHQLLDGLSEINNKSVYVVKEIDDFIKSENK